MRGEIIAIGDELTSGRILNTTSSFAAAQLFAAGHEIIAMTTIGDDAERIGQMVQQALNRADFVIVTGGLGATTDDLTTEAVADALDRPTTFYPEILRKIEARGWQGPINGNVSLEKLAWLPAGAHALHTEARMAGFFLVQDSKPIFFLPGVPHEMKELLIETVITRLAVWEGGAERVVRQRLYKTFGLAETEINNRLDGLADETRGIRIGYYPVFPEVHVSLTIGEDDESAAMGILRDLDDRIVRLLGTNLFGTDDETLEGVIGNQLLEQSRTIAVAESCTGGLIGQRITRVAGSSRYFSGGVVAYSNEMKHRILGVESGMLDRHGAVSGPVAQAMAEGVRNVCRADLGLSVTGIAGPGGGSPEKPVGTVFVGMAAEEGVRSYQFNFAGSRWQIQERTAQQALDIVRRFFLDNA